MLGVLFVGAVLLGPNLSRAELEPVRPGQDTFISRIAFAEQRLWLLTDAGLLSTIAPTVSERVSVNLPEPAFDVWVQNGKVLVITGPSDKAKSWTVRRWDDGSWSSVGAIATTDESLIGVGSSASTSAVLTSKRLIEITGKDMKVTTLTWVGKEIRGGISTMLVTPDAVFVGVNAGEWGGGLRRVDRRTGTVEVLSSTVEDGICGGPLNPECDPVNGLAVMPGKAGCIAAAIGLVHMLSHGRIVEVCGKTVRRLYLKAVDSGLPGEKAGGEPISSVAFFGLNAVGSELWAVGTDGIHQVRPDGSARVIPLPKFQRVGDASVSFAIPGVALVGTSVNQRRSVSGAVPLMVVR
jgi:hypothetical protein